ncbi:helix-turn-helix domain-containing protein [Streptomyces sp. NPDC058623]|uniref:helix-turn-helix domain-containing protein n=1 Tax=Streptomyces sp. NPDC058623 TaxID=3346563 RepID=UPI003649B601
MANTTVLGARTVQNEHHSGNPALVELRERLEVGMARMRLTKTDLAKRAALGRSTVSEALSSANPAPSLDTVAALARALRLPVEELCELRRRAVEDTGGGVRSLPGRPIGEWDPHDLEVHPAGPGDAGSGPVRSAARPMPGYVLREHDRVLEQVVNAAAAGRSGAVMLVGSSSTGKTRACWEAVQPLATKGWRLWHPFDPTRAQDALDDLPRVAPRTVVWLNEAQHYFGDRAAGERIAAAVHRLLVSAERGPVLVLGTLWPEHAARYTALPTVGEPDPHSRVRELLSGQMVSVPEAFDSAALAYAAELAACGDRLLADALTRAHADGRVAQDLAGAPELLNRYQQVTPGAKAILEAAMDARRLGVDLHIPQGFLTDAATDYLTDTDYDLLPDDWAERAYAELAELVHGKQAPLRPTTPRPARRPPTPSPAAPPLAQASSGPVFRLADYLEQHGRLSRAALCPPASFWSAANTFLIRPEELRNLAVSADQRHRLQWSEVLRWKAAHAGDIASLMELARNRQRLRDWSSAEQFALQAAEAGEVDAWLLAVQVRAEAGDVNGALNFLRCATEAGSAMAWSRLAVLQEELGDGQGAEESAGIAASDDVGIWSTLASSRATVGDWERAEEYARRSAAAGYPLTWCSLAYLSRSMGQRDRAERFARLGTEAGEFGAWAILAQLQLGDRDMAGAERSMQHSAALGNIAAHISLTELRHQAGDSAGAEAAAQQSLERGMPHAWLGLALLRMRAGDRDAVENCAKHLEESEHPDAWSTLIRLWQETGNPDKAEAAARKAAEAGHLDAHVHLVRLRHEAGDQEGAQRHARHLADSGHAGALIEHPVTAGELWPHGLDPDGTPTPSWQPCPVAPEA